MNSLVSPKIQNDRYTKEMVYALLEHLNDDDYFYYKRFNWEDWVIMRMDIENVLKKYKNTKHITKDMIMNILNTLNKRKSKNDL